LHLGHVGGRLSSHLFRDGQYPVGKCHSGPVAPSSRLTARSSMDPGLPSTLFHAAPCWWKNREKIRHHDCFISGITPEQIGFQMVFRRVAQS